MLNPYISEEPARKNSDDVVPGEPLSFSSRASQESGKCPKWPSWEEGVTSIEEADPGPAALEFSEDKGLHAPFLMPITCNPALSEIIFS